MDETTSREKILKKVRNALISKLENPYQYTDFESSVYKKMDDSLDIIFAEEFNKASGKFIYCESFKEFLKNLSILISENKWESIFCREENLFDQLKSENIPFKHSEADFKETLVGLSSCEALISRLGSIMVSSRQSGGRRINAYPEIHLVFAYTSQLVPDIKDGIKVLQEKYKKKLPSLTTLITGPSRTADIEKTLVMGAHGPKELYLFFIDDSTN